MDIIIGNILSFIGSFLDFIFNMKFNEKPKILKGNCLTSTISLLAYIFLRAYDGLIDCIVTLLRLITIYFKDKYNKKCSLLFIIFLGLYLLVFLKYSGIQTIILFISSMFVFIPKWISKDMQKIRICSLVATVLSIIYNIMIYNYAAISMQLVSILFIIITIIKWSKERKIKG